MPIPRIKVEGKYRIVFEHKPAQNISLQFGMNYSFLLMGILQVTLLSLGLYDCSHQKPWPALGLAEPGF